MTVSPVQTFPRLSHLGPSAPQKTAEDDTTGRGKERQAVAAGAGQISYLRTQGMDLGALLPARQATEASSLQSDAGNQSAYAKAIEAIGGEVAIPFAYHSEPEYSLNP